jgi:hypothetical protein
MNVFLENKFFESTKILEAGVASARTKYAWKPEFFARQVTFFSRKKLS